MDRQTEARLSCYRAVEEIRADVMVFWEDFCFVAQWACWGLAASCFCVWVF